MAIEKRVPPEWVKNILNTVDHVQWLVSRATEDIDFMTREASIGKAETVTQDLMHARHDADHAFQHLGQIRRTLRMTWPEVDDEPD